MGGLVTSVMSTWMQYDAMPSYHLQSSNDNIQQLSLRIRVLSYHLCKLCKLHTSSYVSVWKVIWAITKLYKRVLEIKKQIFENKL
jgi:hypothetical protein